MHSLFAFFNLTISCMTTSRKNRSAANKAHVFLSLLCEIALLIAVGILALTRQAYPMVTSDFCGGPFLLESSYILIQLTAFLSCIFQIILRHYKNSSDRRLKSQNEEYGSQSDEESEKEQEEEDKSGYSVNSKYDNQDHYGNKIQFGTINIKS